MKNMINILVLLSFLCVGSTRTMEENVPPLFTTIYVSDEESEYCQTILDDSLISFCCVENINLALIRGILQKGANVNVQYLGARLQKDFGFKGEVVLNFGPEFHRQIFTPLSLAALSENIPLVNLLLDSNADINLAEKQQGRTALMLTLRTIHSSGDMVNCLMANNANVHMKDKNGVSTLMYATYSANVPAVKKILESNVDILAKSVTGDNALRIAYKGPFVAYTAHYNAIIALLENALQNDTIYK